MTIIYCSNPLYSVGVSSDGRSWAARPEAFVASTVVQIGRWVLREHNSRDSGWHLNWCILLNIDCSWSILVFMFQHLFSRHKDPNMFWTFDRFWNSLSRWHQKVGGLRYLHRIVACWQPGGSVWPTWPDVDPGIPFFHWVSFRLCWWLWCGESDADCTATLKKCSEHDKNKICKANIAC